jgi:hypothetical protein
MIRQNAFITTRYLFIELSRVQIPVDTSGTLDSVIIQLVCRVFTAEVFRLSFGADRSHSSSPFKEVLWYQ